MPRPEIEQNLGYLAAKLAEGPGWVGVCGPAGVGKTLLLRLLLRRQAAAFTPVYVPTAALAPAELARWIENEAGARTGERVSALARLLGIGRPL